MMDREQMEQYIIAKLYGEISAEEQARLDDWLAEYPADRREYEELEKALSLLHCVEDAPTAGKPIQLPSPVGQEERRGGMTWWKVAAAAVVLAMLAGFWRGFAVEMGGVRLAIGPAAENRPQEEPLTKDYLHEMVQTVQNVNTTNEQLLKRQEDMESDLYLLKVANAASMKLTDRKIERFSEELVRRIDSRMASYKTYYPLSAGNASRNFNSGQDGAGERYQFGPGRSRNDENEQDL
ncbi:hypothetical protein GF373_05110 [bacterium]|nr:hypothetical protein [bacterium]